MTTEMKPAMRRDLEQTRRANATTRTPVVFVHGLWMLSESWAPWAELFQEHGYTPVSLSWPDDPETVTAAHDQPEEFAGKSVGQVADHLEALIGELDRKPVVIGHSFGGLLTQILAGRGLSAAAVAVDPAPFRGVLPLPLSALRGSQPVLGNPANRRRAVALTFEEFRYASPTRCPRTRPANCTSSTPSPPPAPRSSRPRPPISTPGPR